jgi:purine-cytosine permease-like protein
VNVLGSVDLSVALEVVDAAVIAVVPLLALYLRYRSVRDIRSGVIRVGLGLMVGCLLGMVTARAFASVTGYSAATRSIVCEMGIVAAGCVVGIAAGGWTWLSGRRIHT